MRPDETAVAVRLLGAAGPAAAVAEAVFDGADSLGPS
jgi:hypothetical protein